MPKLPSTPPLSVVSGDNSVMTPPRPLGVHGSTLWRSVQAEYNIQDAGGIAMLMQACSSLDRAEELREAIAAEGATVTTRTGSKAHPAIKDELQARSFLVRTLERLGLNFEAVKPCAGRPTKPPGWVP